MDLVKMAEAVSSYRSKKRRMSTGEKIKDGAFVASLGILGTKPGARIGRNLGYKAVSKAGDRVEEAFDKSLRTGSMHSTRRVTSLMNKYFKNASKAGTIGANIGMGVGAAAGVGAGLSALKVKQLIKDASDRRSKEHVSVKPAVAIGAATGLAAGGARYASLKKQNVDKIKELVKSMPPASDLGQRDKIRSVMKKIDMSHKTTVPRSRGVALGAVTGLGAGILSHAIHSAARKASDNA